MDLDNLNCGYCEKYSDRKKIYERILQFILEFTSACFAINHFGMFMNFPSTTENKNEKLNACLLCGKEFAMKSHLEVYISTHTCEKPFKCIVCQKSFST